MHSELSREWFAVARVVVDSVPTHPTAASGSSSPKPVAGAQSLRHQIAVDRGRRVSEQEPDRRRAAKCRTPALLRRSWVLVGEEDVDALAQVVVSKDASGGGATVDTDVDATLPNKAGPPPPSR